MKDKKQKIAMIGHKRIPSREGGVEVVVEELSARLVNDGYDVVAFNRKGKNVQDSNADKSNKKIKEYRGIRLKRVFTINKKGIDALLYSINATIKALFGHFSILHYHAEGCSAMTWLPHLFHKKIVVTIHGLDWQRGKWAAADGKLGMGAKYILHGEKNAVKYADEIIVLSKNMQKYFKDTYNRDTVLIANGVSKPTNKAANIITEKYGLKENDYILFLARIVPEKGLDYLIDAYKQLDTDKKLVIAGGPSHSVDYYTEIQEKVKDNSNIIMTGFVQGEELEELFSNCYLYCLPSDVEGMPLTLLEAMSYGRNVLTSDIPENAEVTEDYGTSFKKSNVDDLKTKLEGCLKGQNRKTSEEISNYILNKYSWDKNAKETEKIYKKFMKTRNEE